MEQTYRNMHIIIITQVTSINYHSLQTELAFLHNSNLIEEVFYT